MKSVNHVNPLFVLCLLQTGVSKIMYLLYSSLSFGRGLG